MTLYDAEADKKYVDSSAHVETRKADREVRSYLRTLASRFEVEIDLEAVSE